MRSDDLIDIAFSLLYIVGIGAFFIWLIVRGQRARAAVDRGDGLARILPALGGEIARDPSFDGPFLRFRTGESSTYCYQGLLFEGRTQLVTTFECRVGFRAFLEATAESSLRYPTRFPRFREIAQEASFRIVTTDAPWAMEILNSGLRAILADFGRRWGRARVQLAVDRFLVEVESSVTPGEAADLARLVARVAALGRATNVSAGVTFLESVSVGFGGRCPVCGRAFEVAGVTCAQCKVPHHPDCWAYWGQCAIFGCKGRRIALPTSVSP